MKTTRRRILQLEYNAKHGIHAANGALGHRLPAIEEEIAARQYVQEVAGQAAAITSRRNTSKSCTPRCWRRRPIWNSKRAAELRDRMAKLKGDPVAAPQMKKRRARRR